MLSLSDRPHLLLLVRMIKLGSPLRRALSAMACVLAVLNSSGLGFSLKLAVLLLLPFWQLDTAQTLKGGGMPLRMGWAQCSSAANSGPVAALAWAKVDTLSAPLLLAAVLLVACSRLANAVLTKQQGTDYSPPPSPVLFL